MGLRAIRLLFLIGGCLAIWAAWEQYKSGTAVMAERDAAQQKLSLAVAEIQSLMQVEPTVPLKAETEALQDFLASLIDDTELLGSSVRMNFEKSGVIWEPVEYGVQRANLSLGTAAERQAAMGYLTLVWQLLQQRPAQVISASVKIDDDIVKFDLQVQLYALTGAF